MLNESLCDRIMYLLRFRTSEHSKSVAQLNLNTIWAEHKQLVHIMDLLFCMNERLVKIEENALGISKSSAKGVNMDFSSSSVFQKRVGSSSRSKNAEKEEEPSSKKKQHSDASVDHISGSDSSTVTSTYSTSPMLDTNTDDLH